MNSLCSSVKKRIWLGCLSVLLSIGLTGPFSQSAMAVELAFNISAPTSGAISYDGTGSGLIGANIEVDNVVGLSTPANANVISLCVSSVLNFTSGSLSNAGGPPPSGNNFSL